jgi:RNA polymerase-binding transcription factor DksA
MKATGSIPARSEQLGGPWWRALLEARWRGRLQEVTELSLEFHDAAAAAPAGGAGRLGPAVQRLMQRATSARRAFADTDEALERLASGRFGQCETCGGAISVRTLRTTPEARYCAVCSDVTPASAALAVAAS